MNNLFNISDEKLRKLSKTGKIKVAEAIAEYNIRYYENPLAFFNPQSYQMNLWKSSKKERWILGGNRSGKTMNGAAFVIEFALQFPGSEILCSTWAALTITVQQKKIFELLPKDGSVSYAKFTEKGGFVNRLIVFANGSIIRFKTYDQESKAQAGTSKDLIWNDEEPPKEVYNEEKARLIDRDGLMITTLTPVDGITWLDKDVVRNKKIFKYVDIFYWNTFENQFIKQEAFKRIISQYSYKEAITRSTGKIMNLNSGRLYYAFDEDMHCKELRLNKNYPLILSFDFNVDPMTTLICQIVPGKAEFEQKKVLNVLESFNTNDSNTRNQCERLKEKLKSWKGKIIIYGDASHQRRTETAKVNETNWTIVKMYFPETECEYRVPNDNPNIKERIGWVNAKLTNFENKIGIYLNKDFTEELKTDLENGIWDKLQKQKDKSKSSKYLHHNSDALDYIISQEFPLQPEAFGETDYERAA